MFLSREIAGIAVKCHHATRVTDVGMTGEIVTILPVTLKHFINKFKSGSVLLSRNIPGAVECGMPLVRG